MRNKSANQKSGLILVDILLALTLGAFFIALITYSSVNAEDTFETARERSYALDLYEAHAAEFEGMMPYESRNITVSTTTMMSAYAHWYGNDRIQTDISIEGIIFNAIRTYPFPSINDSIGTPICSVDFSSREYAGSYGFQHPSGGYASSTDSGKPPTSLVPSIIPIILPINATIPLTDIEVRNNIAYISTDSSVAADPDLIVTDITNTKAPTIISSINTGPGISAIALAGNRVFAAAASTAAQLHVIRFDGLNAPMLEKKYSLPLPYATATPPMASSISYDKNTVYLGTEKWDGEELSVIDMASPIQPIRKGSLEVGSKIMDIFVRNRIAYVGTAGEQQLVKLDISNPTNPLILDHFNPSGWERQEGKVTSFFEDELRFGRTSGGFNIKQDHELFSWATSSFSGGSALNPPHTSIDLSGGVYGLIADRSYIYLASKSLNRELQVFDHSFSTSTSASFSLPVAPQTMTCDGDTLYILAGTAPVIYQISFR